MPLRDSDLIRLGVRYGLIALLLAIPLALIVRLLPGFPKPKETHETFLNYFLFAVIIAPLWEEFAFRFGPIWIVRNLTNNRKILWLVIIAVSIVFGYLHGSWHHIFIQGVVGLIFSKAFLRGGYACSVTAHATYNASYLLLVPF